MTNADKIRAMSDEELADFINRARPSAGSSAHEKSRRCWHTERLRKEKYTVCIIADKKGFDKYA